MPQESPAQQWTLCHCRSTECFLPSRIEPHKKYTLTTYYRHRVDLKQYHCAQAPQSQTERLRCFDQQPCSADEQQALVLTDCQTALNAEHKHRPRATRCIEGKVHQANADSWTQLTIDNRAQSADRDIENTGIADHHCDIGRISGNNHQ